MSPQPPHLHARLAKRKKLTTFDKVIMVAAFIYPLSGLPQVFEVFQGNVSGVSLISWIGFTAFSTLFLIYGIIHQLKPVIITNFLWIIVDVLVIVGVLINSMMAMMS